MANILVVACDPGLYGAERILRAVADRLARTAKVVVAVPAQGALADTLAANPLIEVVVVPMPAIAKKPLTLLNYVLGAPAALIRLLARARAHSIDIVYVNTLRNFLGMIAARLARAGCVWHLHEKNWHGFLGKIAAWIVFLGADVVIFNSAFVRDSFLRYVSGLARKSYLIYNGVDVEKLEQLADWRDDSPWPTGWLRDNDAGPVIGFFGRLVEQKRPLDFVEMAALVSYVIPNCRFVMVGSGRLKADVVERAASLRLIHRLYVFDFMANPYPLMKSCALIVVPSADEGYSLVAAEALALEVPVVCADSGALPELVEDGKTGLLYPLGDVAALVKRVTYLLRNPDARRMLGKAGGERVRARFVLERQLREIVKHVKSVRSVRQEA